MSQSIQRQRDQYAVFGPPQLSRLAGEDRRELPPESAVADLLKGRRVGAGQLNPAQRETPGHRIAVDTRGMDPEEHAYHGEPGEGRGDYNWGLNRRELDEAQEREHELAGEDDISGYNWGPEPSFDDGAEPGPHPDFHGDAPHPFGTPVYNPGGYDPHLGSRLDFTEARRHVADDGLVPAFNPMLFYPGQHLNPHSMMFGAEPEREFAGHGEVPPRWPTAAASTERVAHGYYPSNRVGLPYKDTIIPGTVTHLDGYNVGVRWDDGQHSSENPVDLRPL